MNTKDAAFMTGHDHPGGIPTLAARMDTDARELIRKFNPREANGISLDEAEVVMELRGDHHIFHAIAADLGYVCAPAPDADPALDVLENVLPGFSPQSLKAMLNRSRAGKRYSRSLGA